MPGLLKALNANASLFHWRTRERLHSCRMAFTPAARSRLQSSLAVAGALFAWWRWGGVWPAALAGLLAALALLAWVAPARYAPIQRVFDRIVHGILAVLTWLALGVVYFGVFTPWRAWRAMWRKDPLDRSADPAAKTYLRAVPPGTLARFDRQF
jgi:ABC-type xylose transport system permease subunit